MKTSRLAAPFAVLLLAAGCGRHHPTPSANAPALPPAKVRLATARTEQLPDMTTVAGVVRPVQRAQLAAKVMGTIQEMPVTLGQRVKTGDVLAKISAGEISARVTQAQAQLNAARRDLERERGLLKQGASTADMVRGLEDRFSAADAQVREAETMLGYATLRAPFEGVVARKLANAGDLASPGLPLLEIEGTDRFQIEAAVPDSLASGLKPDAELGVEVPAVAAKFVATLAELSSSADPSAHTVLAKLAVPADTRVRSGQYARIQIPGSPVASLTVPAGAVSAIGQMERVFVAGADGRAVLRLVKTGATRNDRIEILAGLDPEERVVVGPPAGLREGQHVEALR